MTTPQQEFQEYIQILRQSNANHALERAERERRRQFRRNVAGALLVVFGVPILFFAPFVVGELLARLFGG